MTHDQKPISMYSLRLQQLRDLLPVYQIDGIVVPSVDPYAGEYPPAYYRRLEWLTGFTGSNGLAIITKNKAYFFTDGRYTLQAAEQLKGLPYQILNIGQHKPWQWAGEQLSDQTLGFDPWLHSQTMIERYPHAKFVASNPIDQLWHDRPEAPCSEIVVHDLKYAGLSCQEKLANVIDQLRAHQAEACIITAPDSICWLLNMRGDDVPHTPLVLGYAMVHVTGRVDWYVEGNRQCDVLPACVRLHAITDFLKDLEKIQFLPVGVDLDHVPVVVVQALRHPIPMPDPCVLPKACKNPVEIAGMRQAHITDGIAVTRFLQWLDAAVKKGQALDELKAARRLEAYREEGALYQQPSFDTISGFGAHGAIVHYRATKQSNAGFTLNQLYLVDSGGQYLNGTTDITRTVAIGTPTDEQKHRFTLVLKGHIALATAIFKQGTTGSELDHLARQFLQAEGLDYDHGTGHGVGCYLGVHEGPQRISKLPNTVPLMPGMIISNEPGYYKEGEYGIRIENLVVVVNKPSHGEDYLGFETITLAPIDTSLIEERLLTYTEKKWLAEYHEQVERVVGG